MLRDDYLDLPVYGLADAEKRAVLEPALCALTAWHNDRCAPYARILHARQYHAHDRMQLEEIPFLPVRLFKHHRLASVPDTEIIKELTSSGTSSQQVSRILLDQTNARMQSRALVLILQQFLGKARLPMLIIDHDASGADRQSLSARRAGIAGVGLFGRNHTYALRPDMSLDHAAVDAFLAAHGDEPFLMFGFTFMVWQYFYRVLHDAERLGRFGNAILIHGGGWKKLQDVAVSNTEFRRTLGQTLGISRIHDYYGMVEQVGSIFMECEHGRLHTPSYADVIIRHPGDWTPTAKEEQGLIQVLSLLPTSYPGHSLLTEDLGRWLGVDDCPCGRLGKTFAVQGRLPRAELRGCSDTFTPRAEGKQP